MSLTRWKRRPVRELCSAIVDCVNKTAPTIDGPTPWRMIRTTNVRNGRVDLGRVRYVEEDVYRKWIRRGAPKSGDIILTREAPLGEVGMLTEDSGIFLGQRLVLYRPDPQEADRNFLLGALQAPDVQSQIKAFGSGATVEHMRVPDCGELLIDCPALEVQRKIGAVLAAFNDQIEINERRIALLEDLARSVYREWFVHFRFPGYRDTAFRESALGPIPRNWSISCLGDLADVVLDSVEPASLDASTNYVGLEHLPRRRTTLQHWDSLGSVSSRKLRFSRGDTLFGKIRPYFHKVGWAPFDGIASSDTIILRPQQDPGLTAFVNTVASSDRLVAEAVATSNGTKMPRADPKALLGFQLAIPGHELLLAFEEAVRPWLGWSAELVQLNKNLAATRHLLLPCLVSGELDISDMDLGILAPLVAE